MTEQEYFSRIYYAIWNSKIECNDVYSPLQKKIKKELAI